MFDMFAGIQNEGGDGPALADGGEAYMVWDLSAPVSQSRGAG